jgi:hypothetical protein
MKYLCHKKLLVALFLPILLLTILFSSLFSVTKVEAKPLTIAISPDIQALTASSIISFGETISGSISAAGETDVYTFTVNVGDVILVGVTKVSGNVWPKIRLYDAANNLLNEKTTFGHAEIIQKIAATSPTSPELKVYLPVVLNNYNNQSSSSQSNAQNFTLIAATSGTFSVLVNDGFNGTFTGEYNLFLQRLNPPANPNPIAYDETLTNTITLAAEMDAFTFSANAGDKILIGATQLSDVWPRIQLFNPQGELMIENGTHTHFEITETLTTTGNYTILFNDSFGGDSKGDYALHLQKLNPPTNPASLSYGQTITETISMPAEMDAYTFAASAGDKILIGATQISDVWLGVQLYDPQGNLLTSHGTHTHSEITHTLTTGGNYTILFNDSFNGDSIGDYALHLQKLNPPTNAANLTYDQSVTETLSMPAEMDAYVFTGGAGDTVRIAATQLSDVWPGVQLFDPQGHLLVAQSSHTYFEITHTLSTAGTHAILINDGFQGDSIGDYNITLSVSP